MTEPALALQINRQPMMSYRSGFLTEHVPMIRMCCSVYYGVPLWEKRVWPIPPIWAVADKKKA